MAVGDIYSETVVMNHGGVNFANILYLKVDADAGPDKDDDEVAADFIASVIPTIQATQSDQVTYECVLQRKVSPVTAPSKVYEVLGTGDSVLHGLPTNQAVLLRHQSLPAQIQNYGRLFLAGVPEGWVSKGRVKFNFISDFEPLLNILTQGFTVGGTDYRMVHHSPTLATYQNIVTASINPRVTKFKNRTRPLCSIS